MNWWEMERRRKREREEEEMELKVCWKERQIGNIGCWDIREETIWQVDGNRDREREREREREGERVIVLLTSIQLYVSWSIFRIIWKS